MNQNEPYRAPEYPFGFGFALMSDARAIERFSQMSEAQRRDLGRKLQAISSDTDLQKLIEELALERKN